MFSCLLQLPFLLQIKLTAKPTNSIARIQLQMGRIQLQKQRTQLQTGRIQLQKPVTCTTSNEGVHITFVWTNIAST